MSLKKKPSSGVKTLRYRAENVLKTTNMQVKKMSLPEIQHLVHEVQVHQIELEMQNEELRQAQLDLQAARDRYADLYGFAPVGFLTLNTRGQILEANLPACQLLGVERKTLLRQKLEKFVMATDQSILRKHLHSVEQTRTKEFSDVIRLKYNAPSAVRLESLYEESGLQNLEAQFRLVLLDLTEQGKTKALQKEQELWMGAILDSAMDAIITIDEDRNIVLFNDSAEKMFGVVSKEVMGQSIDQFIPQRFLKDHAAHIQNFKRGSSTNRRLEQSREVTGLRANGKEFPIEASISKVTLETGARYTVVLRDITERVEAMKSLEVSEREQRSLAQVNVSILNALAAHIALVDANGVILSVNEAWKRFATANVLKGANYGIGCNYIIVCEQAHGDCAEEGRAVADGLRAVLAGTQKSFALEYPCHAPNEERWFRVMITPISGTENAGAVVMHLNVTERKQAEQEIALLLKRNESILNSAWEGIYGIDWNGKVTFFNKSAENLTGWTGPEVHGQVLHLLLHHTKLDGTPYPWKKCPVYFSLIQGKVHSVDNEVLWRKDGTSFLVEYTSTPVHNEAKEVQGAVVTFRDITARKESEAALRESEERFQAFMHFSPTVTFIKDADGRYVYVNPSFEKFLNTPLAQCLGKTDLQLFPPDVAREFIAHDQEVQKTGEFLETEETTLDEAGHLRYCLVMKFPVHNKGEDFLLGGVALDITVRKQAEEALRQREEELTRSQEVLQTLGGKLLSAQEDERRRISRELHDDMNQRLAVLAFNLQSAQQGLAESAPMYQTFQKLYEGVSSLSDDVRHLAYQLHPSILDDLGLIVALQTFVDDFAKWEGIPVAFSSTGVPVSLPLEIGSCLYRVAQESLRNAAKHAQCTQIEVKLLGVDGGLRLTILDNGKGFGIKERRVSKDGLGLIGMEERVRVVQGTYVVQSAPGQGTKITVWVPIPKEESL
jgi:PAS domain S-box-containing protein